jgi:hypothetical protein
MVVSTISWNLWCPVKRNYILIYGFKPFINLFTLFSSVSTSSGASRDSSLNSLTYQSIGESFCRTLSNSLLLSSIILSGTWVLRNLSLNSTQVITDPGGFIVNTDSHQHADGPVNMYEVYRSFSSSLQPTTSNFLSVSLSQYSASIGSMVDVIRLQRIYNFLCSMLVFTPFS